MLRVRVVPLRFPSASFPIRSSTRSLRYFPTSFPSERILLPRASRHEDGASGPTVPILLFSIRRSSKGVRYPSFSGSSTVPY